MNLLCHLAVFLAVPLAVLTVLGHVIHRWAVSHFTVVNDLKALGKERGRGQKLKGTVVVCGGRYLHQLKASI
jgi:hypothetical protein